MRAGRGLRARLTLVTTVLAMVVASAAGCSDEGPTPEPTTTSTVTESVPPASPTAEPMTEPSPAPTRPAAMENFDEEGALAAATYFLDLFPYVMNTHDLTEWNALSDEVCEFCRVVATTVADEESAGRTLTGLKITVSGRNVVPLNSNPESFQVDFLIAESATKNRGKSGTVVKRTDQTQPTKGAMILKADSDGDWKVAYLSIGDGAL